MLTQGLAPDPKCELNLTSFFTLPHPLHCPICAKDIIVTVLLLQVMRGCEGWGGSCMLGFGLSCFFYFCSVFVLLLAVLSWLVHARFLCLFHYSFFAFFVSGLLN